MGPECSAFEVRGLSRQAIQFYDQALRREGLKSKRFIDDLARAADRLQGLIERGDER